IAGEVEAVEVEARVLEHEIGEEAVAEEFLQRLTGSKIAGQIGAARRADDPGGPVRRIALAARLVAGEDQLARARVVRTVIDLARRRDLRRRQAGAGILARLALHRRRIEAAVARVVEERVGRDTAILARAFCQRGLGQHGELARWDVACRIVEQRLLVPDEAGEEVGPGVGWRADDDAVEIVGEALRLHQRLAAAVRATGEIGALRALPGEGGDDRLRVVGRLLEGAVAEIDDPFRMAQSEKREPARRVSVIGRGAGIAAPDRLREAGIADTAAEAAAAELLVFAVEAAVRGYPDFEMDQRIAARGRSDGDAAEGRQAGERRVRAGRREAAAGHRL